MAHEIGHNLGMEHDFVGGNINRKRFSKNGEQCTGIGGYMDYRDNPTRWSPCSAEDFHAYFSGVDQGSSVCLGKTKSRKRMYHGERYLKILIEIICTSSTDNCMHICL